MENKANDSKMMVKFEIDNREIKLTPSIVKEYIVGDSNANITNQEFKLFTELCMVRKLNPFLKEAYLIKYGNQPAQIVVGKDAILKRAINNKDFNGREQGIIIQNEEDEIEYRKGTFKLSTENLVGGWAKVYRKNWEYPTEVTVSFEEVAQKKKDGELNSNWLKKGPTMVEKVALVRALRETFSEDIGGMIDESEAWDSKDLSKNKRTVEEATIVQDDVGEAEKSEGKKVNIEDLG